MAPQQFYAQLDRDDLYMLVGPRTFQPVLREWFQIPLPRCLPISACHYCDEWVQVSMHGEEMVLGHNWPEVVRKYELEEADAIVFKLTGWGLKLAIFKSASSTSRDYACPYHG